MRFAVELFRAQLPQLRVSGVAELEASVAAEHRDAFVEIVERRPLDRDERVERAFERQRVGHVLEGEHQAAERMGRDHHADGRPVGAVSQLLLRLDQLGKHRFAFLLERGEIDLFGQPALAPQRLEGFAK